jgi:hypothetical protein
VRPSSSLIKLPMLASRGAKEIASTDRKFTNSI